MFEIILSMLIIIYFLCELFLACVDANSNCLSNGKAVLDKYGFVSEEFNSNLMILFIFSIFANVLSYVGVLNRMKKQPAY